MQINTFNTDELLRYAGVHATTLLEQELTRKLEKLSEEYDDLDGQLTKKSEELETKDNEISALERKLERIRDILED